MELDYRLYLHDADKAAMAALKAIPAFSQVMKTFLKIWNEQEARIVNMSTNLRLGEKQMTKYYNMLPPICEKLGIEVPELFVELDVRPNAYSYGDTKPYIVITSGLFSVMPDELIATVLAHECGHIACHHTLYRTMGRAVLGGMSAFLSGVGNIALYPIQLAFAHWMRCGEFSADRAAVICDGSADKLTEAMMCFAGYDKSIMSEANVEAFMEQALEYKSLVRQNVWNKTLEFMLLQNNSHPWNVIRAYEGREWAQTERYQNILKYIEHMSLGTAEEDRKFLVEVPLKKMVGKNVEDIHAKLLTMGFDNVKTVRNTEPVKMKEGKITAITIDGFREDGWYKRDDEVVIEYYEQKTEEDIALEHPGEVKIGSNPKHFLGKPYEEAEAELRELGFTNVLGRRILQQTPRQTPLYKPGGNEKDYAVVQITVNGQEQFNRHSWFPKESEIVLSYYVHVKQDLFLS